MGVFGATDDHGIDVVGFVVKFAKIDIFARFRMFLAGRVEVAFVHVAKSDDVLTGAAIDEFARRINTSPYFKDLLVPVEGFKFTERPPQPRPDPSDPLNPNALFVPFTIQLTLTERILTNE